MSVYYKLLKEDGDHILLETEDLILLENTVKEQMR